MQIGILNLINNYFLQSPLIVMPFIDNACCLFGNGFLEGMLQPHLSAHGATVNEGGMAFFVQGLVFCLGMALCGYVCN